MVIERYDALPEVQKINKLFKNNMSAVIENFIPISKEAKKIVIRYCYKLADNRIVYLAKHGKNKRIRKKNHKKAMQQGFERYSKIVNNGGAALEY